MIDKHTRVVAIKKQISTDLGGEVAVLHLESGIYYSLNAVGARIWTFIQNSRTVDDVLVDLAEAYKVAPREIRPELIAFLEDLRAENLILVENVSPT